MKCRNVFTARVSNAIRFNNTNKHLVLALASSPLTLSLTLSVTAGREEAARRSEDVRQVPGEAFHLLTGFTLYCPRAAHGHMKKGDMPLSHAHYFVFSSLSDRGHLCCSRRSLEDGLFCPSLEVGRGVCWEKLLRLSAYWPTSNLARHPGERLRGAEVNPTAVCCRLFFCFFVFLCPYILETDMLNRNLCVKWILNNFIILLKANCPVLI